ncbi:hypothetical protein GQ53DRAFT_755802 [Thozetella sp. PMI_491]|nr:hypothetical protein GQ53DRAFT_755802 [Thozetella sp. PMI_491]
MTFHDQPQSRAHSQKNGGGPTPIPARTGVSGHGACASGKPPSQAHGAKAPCTGQVRDSRLVASLTTKPWPDLNLPSLSLGRIVRALVMVSRPGRHRRFILL